jgi:hypothetical protein
VLIYRESAMNTEIPQNGEKSHKEQSCMLVSWHGSNYRKISDKSQSLPSSPPSVLWPRHCGYPLGAVACVSPGPEPPMLYEC